MRVLLINPPPYQRVDQYDTPDFTRLGLAYLAGQLLTNPECKVEIIDAKFERLEDHQVMERVRQFGPDIVGLTAITNEIKPAARIAKQVKHLSSNIHTVIGGVHLSALPHETMIEFPEFDYGVNGEGEITFQELCYALHLDTPLSGIDGLVYRQDDLIVQTGERERIADQDEIPFPAWDLLPPAERYLFMTQRGCPFMCNFCMNPNGRIVRKRSVEKVLEELVYIMDRFGPKRMYICDEIFTSEDKRTHAILDGMIDHGINRKLAWFAQTHVNLVDREMFRKMKEAGCAACGLGIETGDPEIMKNMKKGITVDKVIAASNMADDVGLPIESFMIIGHPNETWDTAMRSIDLAVKVNAHTPLFGVMVPFPGTQVAELARKGEGGYRLISNDWNDYNKQIGHAMEFENLSRRQLEIIQMIGYFKVFLWNFRWKDLAKFIWQYKSEGWAVVKKIIFGLKPKPVQSESTEEPVRISPYFQSLEPGNEENQVHDPSS